MRNVVRDPLDDFNDWDDEQYEWLQSRPVCDLCKDPIQEEFYYDLGGMKICEHCKDEGLVYIDD